MQDEIEALKSQLVELGTVNTDGEQGATVINIKSTNSKGKVQQIKRKKN